MASSPFITPRNSASKLRAPPPDPTTPRAPSLMDVSALSPRPDPLALFLWASVDPRDRERAPRLIKNIQRPQPSERKLVVDVFRLAEALIIHPKGLPIAVKVLSGGATGEDVHIEAALRLVLATNKFDLYLDPRLDKTTVFGKHYRPSWPAPNNDTSAAIYFNPWHFHRLLEAEGERFADPMFVYRHTLLVAVGFAHELIHALRGPVYDLLRIQGINIPYDTPSSPSVIGEGGWQFESELLGGEIFGCWAFDGSVSSSSSGLLDPTVLEELHEQGRMLKSETKTMWTFHTFDFLAIYRNGKAYEVTDSWLTSLCTSFERGNGIDHIEFPPHVEEEPILLSEVARLGLRDDGEGDIVRLNRLNQGLAN